MERYKGMREELWRRLGVEQRRAEPSSESGGDSGSESTEQSRMEERGVRWDGERGHVERVGGCGELSGMEEGFWEGQEDGTMRWQVSTDED
eukprot:391882-Rhodomonas_salina.5